MCPLRTPLYISLGLASDRAAGLEHTRQVAGLGGDVEARRQAHALERLLGGKPLADLPQYGHFPLGPFHAQATGRGQIQIFDVVFLQLCD